MSQAYLIVQENVRGYLFVSAVVSLSSTGLFHQLRGLY